MSNVLVTIVRRTAQTDKDGNIVGHRDIENTRIFPEESSFEKAWNFCKSLGVNRCTITFETDRCAPKPQEGDE